MAKTAVHNFTRQRIQWQLRFKVMNVQNNKQHSRKFDSSAIDIRYLCHLSKGSCEPGATDSNLCCLINNVLTSTKRMLICTPHILEWNFQGLHHFFYHVPFKKIRKLKYSFQLGTRNKGSYTPQQHPMPSTMWKTLAILCKLPWWHNEDNTSFTN